MTEPIPELPGQTTIEDLLEPPMNDAYSANERRWLEEDPDECDVLSCPNDAEPGSILCARHEDDLYEYGNGDSQ